MKLPINTSLALLFILFATVGIAQDAPVAKDPIKDRLDAAILEFDESTLNAREALVQQIDGLTEKTEDNKRLSVARKIELLDSLKAARKSLVEDGEIPSITQLRGPVRIYKLALDNARGKCEDAYEHAAEEYGKTGELDAAKRVLQELEDFRRPPKKVVDDAIRTGSRWKGIRGTIDMALVIDKREDTKFSGRITLSGESYVVEGQIDGNDIEFATAPKPGTTFRQAYKGKLTKNRIDFQFHGVTVKNNLLNGSGYLELRAE